MINFKNDGRNNMKNLLTSIAFIGTALFTMNATAASYLDADVTSNVIMGSGITNGGWTINQKNGIELGLRAKTRFPASNDFPNDPPNQRTYKFLTGNGAGNTDVDRPLWNFEFSVNSNYNGNGGNLSDYTYRLSIDTDPTSATDFYAFDVINGAAYDHALGDNSTAQGAGTSYLAGDYFAALDDNNLAQNSWSMHWFAAIDPNVEGIYTFMLEAFDGNSLLASENMRVHVSAVPVPAALPLFGAALLGMGFIARRRKNKKNEGLAAV